MNILLKDLEIKNGYLEDFGAEVDYLSSENEKLRN